jgi:hypothetical protein
VRGDGGRVGVGTHTDDLRALARQPLCILRASRGQRTNSHPWPLEQTHTIFFSGTRDHISMHTTHSVDAPAPLLPSSLLFSSLSPRASSLEPREVLLVRGHSPVAFHCLTLHTEHHCSITFGIYTRCAWSVHCVQLVGCPARTSYRTLHIVLDCPHEPSL